MGQGRGGGGHPTGKMCNFNRSMWLKQITPPETRPEVGHYSLDLRNHTDRV